MSCCDLAVEHDEVDALDDQPADVRQRDVAALDRVVEPAVRILADDARLALAALGCRRAASSRAWSSLLVVIVDRFLCLDCVYSCGRCRARRRSPQSAPGASARLPSPRPRANGAARQLGRRLLPQELEHRDHVPRPARQRQRPGASSDLESLRPSSSTASGKCRYAQRRQAEGLLQQDLPRRARQQVRAPHHVGDALLRRRRRRRPAGRQTGRRAAAARNRRRVARDVRRPAGPGRGRRTRRRGPAPGAAARARRPHRRPPARHSRRVEQLVARRRARWFSRQARPARARVQVHSRSRPSRARRSSAAR